MQHQQWLNSTDITNAIKSIESTREKKQKLKFFQRQIRSITLKCNKCDVSPSEKKTDDIDNSSESSNDNIDATDKNAAIRIKKREIGVMGTGCQATMQISVFQVYCDSSCSKESALGFPVAIISHHLPSFHNHDVTPENRYAAQLPPIIKEKGREFFKLPISPRDWRALMKDFCRDKLRHEMKKTYGWSPSVEVNNSLKVCNMC